ncbi:hypothetical protein R6Q59_031580 [Mikania micrantha]
MKSHEKAVYGDSGGHDGASDGDIGLVVGIRFVIDREECFSHKAEYGSTVRFSFVVIKVEELGIITKTALICGIYFCFVILGLIFA